MSDGETVLPAAPDTSGPAASPPVRSGHVSVVDAGWVVAGGAVGTGVRTVVTAVVPRWAGVPVATLGVNLLGAFLLGILLEVLAGRGAETAGGRRVRLLCGTGGLGGFTTYSALSTDTVALLGTTHPGRAVAYGLATVLLGGLASAGGIVSARRLCRSGDRPGRR